MNEEETVEVYCPKAKKKVPVWHCTGSITQKRSACSNWAGQVVIDPKTNTAKVLCMYEEGGM